jgi:hypothetical protein
LNIVLCLLRIHFKQNASFKLLRIAERSIRQRVPHVQRELVILASVCLIGDDDDVGPNRRTTSVLHAIPQRVDELQNLHLRFSAYNTAGLNAFMGERIQFPVTCIDPRLDAPDGATITFSDARSYFDTLLASVQPAISAYEQFIAKYQAEDAKVGRKPD